MKKKILFLIVAVTVSYSAFVFSGSVQTINQEFNWTGFYLGANAGYWQSQRNKVEMTGSTSFINPAFAFGAGNVANALAQMTTNKFSLHPYGFIGGAQVGYNYQYNNRFLLGVDTVFDGLTNSSNTKTLQKTVNLVDFSESYSGSLNIKQKINYLGMIRARLGYLYQPTFLVYATGGFAYGNITLNTDWTAQESLGPAVFPTIDTQKHSSKTLTGWTAGAGIEWIFKPKWSTSLEYTYYRLNDLNSNITLAQINNSISPAVLWGSATAKTSLSISVGTIRLGVNYHFS